MKLNLLAVLFSLTLTSANVFGQITIDRSDLWAIGDSVPRALDTLTSFLPGPNGPNQTWDFSGAVQRVTQTTRVMNPSSTPYASSFATSNAAMTANDSLYLYFNSNTTNIIAKGTAGKLILNNKVTDFSFPLNPDLTTNTFPINYGDSHTDTYGYDAIVDGAGFSVYQVRLKHFGNVFDTIVGWGTVKTNFGTYECLKQKVVEYTVDSTWYKLFSFSSWASAGVKKDTVTSYTWIAKETKLAAAELTFDSLKNPKQLTWTLIAPLSTAIPKTIANKPTIFLFPNPASTELHVVPSQEFNASKFNIRICNFFGQEVYKRTFSSIEDDIKIDLSRFSGGEYILETTSENGSIHCREIFSVIH